MDTYENFKRSADHSKEGRRKKGVLSIYHPNGKGTGCALEIAIVPASDEEEGKVQMVVAGQTSAPNPWFPISDPKFPYFNWDGAICVSLRPVNVAEIIRVFRGETETLRDWKGLHFTYLDGHIVSVQMEHVIEPVNAYKFRFIHCHASGEGKNLETTTDEASIAITPAEALTVMLALEHSMRLLAFGE